MADKGERREGWGMDLLQGALVAQQQTRQTRLRGTQRGTQEKEGQQAPKERRVRSRHAARRGLGRALIAVGTVLVRWAEPAPSAPSPPHLS